VKILTLFSGHRSLSLYRNPRFWGWVGLEQCQRRYLLQKPNLLGSHSISNLFSSHLFKIVHATPLPPTPAANQNVQRSTAQCSCVPLLCCCHRRCRRHRSTSILSQQIKSTRGWGSRGRRSWCPAPSPPALTAMQRRNSAAPASRTAHVRLSSGTFIITCLIPSPFVACISPSTSTSAALSAILEHSSDARSSAAGSAAIQTLRLHAGARFFYPNLQKCATAIV